MHLSWYDTFMYLAELVSLRSKDPVTKVGSCIVDRDHKIVGIGYNGFPRGCSDSDFPWCREGESPLDTKYPYVVHAEKNAIANTDRINLEGCKLFVTLFPCNECAKDIIQSGIREVYYFRNKYPQSLPTVASWRMFNTAGVHCERYEPQTESVSLSLKED